MKKIIAVAFYLLPTLALAQNPAPAPGNTGPTLSNISQLVGNVRGIVNNMIPLVVAIALLLFFWGLAKFMLAAGDEKRKDEGKNLMIWGVISFVVMLSIWGIVAFIQSAFGIGGVVPINVPQV